MKFSSFLCRSTFLALAALPVTFIACGGTSGPDTGSSSAAESTAAGATSSTLGGWISPPACEGPLPDICEECSDGQTECAHWVRVDGVCEVQICPPPATTTADVCTGGLPDICEECPNGKSECAHWVHVDGKCEIQICAPEPTTAAGGSKSDDAGTSAAKATEEKRTSAAAGVTTATGPSAAAVCPPGEQHCKVLDPDGKCSEICVGDTVACVAPPECGHPICDPDGPQPGPSCRWDEQACVWLCLDRVSARPLTTTTAVDHTDDGTSSNAGHGVASSAVTCPEGEKVCKVADPDGLCQDVCVIDTALCVAPTCSHPICDPNGAAPNDDCRWDEKACVWVCAIVGDPNPSVTSL